MSQTNFTPISIYYSTTASAVPTAANLVPGELAINTADGKLYYEDSSGVVQVLATKSTGSIGGSNTQVQFNNSGSLGGSSGLTWDGSFLTTSSIKNSALTSGRVTYAGASGLLSDSANLQFNGTNLGIGATPSAWNAVFRVLNLHDSFNIYGQTNDPASGGLVANSYYGTSSFLYKSNGFATHYTQTDGTHKWLTAPSGTAGNAVTFTEAMRITNAGNVGIGTSSPATTLDVRASNIAIGVSALATAQGQAFVGTTDNWGENIGGTLALGGAQNSSVLTQTFASIAGRRESALGYIYTGYMQLAVSDGANMVERMRITSAGNVGIGTSNPSAKLDVTGQVTATGGIFKANGAPSLSAATAGEAILAPEGTYGALLYGRGSTYDVVIGQRSTGVALAVVAATNNIYTGGNIGLTTTPTTSGTGITFPASQSASSNANTLDDYEEGTWTPTIAGDGTAFVGTTYNARAGKYVKIGDVVYVSFDIDVLLAGALLNNATVGGLPFAIPNASDLSNGGGGIGYITGIQQNYVYQSLYPQNNSSYLYIIGRTAASNYTIFPTSANFFANSIRLTGWAWWRTTV